MKHFIRIHQGIEHKVLGSKDDRKICHGCKIEFNQKNFQIASPKTDRKTQVIYKRLKNKYNTPTKNVVCISIEHFKDITINHNKLKHNTEIM